MLKLKSHILRRSVPIQYVWLEFCYDTVETGVCLVAHSTRVPVPTFFDKQEQNLQCTASILDFLINTGKHTQNKCCMCWAVLVQCGSGSGDLSTKLAKYFSLTKYFLENTNIFIPKPPRRTSKLYRSLQPSKENIQQFKTKHFFTFNFLCIIFAHLDPDPADQNQCWSIRIRIDNIEAFNRVWIPRLYWLIVFLQPICFFWSVLGQA